MIKKVVVFLALLPVYCYRVIVSPIIGANCSYWPSCSRYMITAVERFGPIRGYVMGLRRIGRCHPFKRRKNHGYDPVPYGYSGGAKWVV
jgi:hypothetical protein